MFGTFLNVGIVLHFHNINLADMVSVHDIFRAIPRIVQVHPPAMAGGNRKLTIDRCGFREDGTFYMNGPTTTMQPAASRR